MKQRKALTSLAFDMSPSDIKASAHRIIAAHRAVEDRVASVPLDAVSFDNVVVPLANVNAALAAELNNILFYKSVSAIKAKRDASIEAKTLIDAYFVESGMRKDVADVVAALDAKGLGDGASDEARRFLRYEARDYRRNGLHLPADTRLAVEKLQKELSALSTKFSKHLNEESNELQFTDAELAGLDADFIGALKKKEGKRVVTLKYPHAFPIMKLCSVAATRRALEKAFNNRCVAEGNAALLEEMAEKRAQLARLLGFDTHAAYVLDIRMAKDPQAVGAFLRGLHEQLDAPARAEIAALADLMPEGERDAATGAGTIDMPVMILQRTFVD